MVNEALLEDVIRKSGKRKGYLAEKCGCDIRTLKAKCTNKSVFNTDEVAVLCKELDIKSLRLMNDIFFAKDVDNMSTGK